ncbi:hypothetical protein VNO80_02983 [Phaseolus coccineus]|uniref:Uncharacterized protein n=1 Tax=Phaseolus coccineus TaxID=3886 RepID=A0AAN9NV65_PHACN
MTGNDPPQKTYPAMLFSVNYESNIDHYKGKGGHANLLCIVPILSDVPEGTNIGVVGIIININVFGYIIRCGTSTGTKHLALAALVEGK